MAKGVCFGRDLKLIAVPTLQLLCVPVLLRDTVKVNSEEFATALPDDALLCPMLDARRMEVYAAVYDRSLKAVRDVQADIVDASTYKEWLDQRPVYFFGNGAKKCMDAIAHPNARYIDAIEPIARWMQPLAERRLLNGETEDVAYFEPFYLKDYVAKMPKNLL
jgi:tRNA threonylcarbamoyladenosine biosynthesis protein TsaB